LDGGQDKRLDACLEQTFREEWGRVLAALIGFLGDFDRAEEATQEAFAIAAQRWSREGTPTHRAAWLVTTARNRAINRLRRERTLAAKTQLLEAGHATEEETEPTTFPDERLELIFTCCHPALATEAQVALTLRTLGGLGTDAIARAFLVSEPTMAQRLVRAKRKIRDAGIPYIVPETNDMAARLKAVLTVIYLVFNEGYAATRVGPLVRTDLCAEAIRLGRLVRSLMMPQPPPEATALVALMLLHDARRAARTDDAGDIVVLEEQDRTRWDQKQIAEALPLVEESFRGRPGAFALQAAIAATHCQTTRAEDTDWPRIVRLYDLLERVQPSPIVSLNRAVAVAMADNPTAGLALIDALAAADDLANYHLLHAARADLLRRLGSLPEAAESYMRALALVTNDSERRFLERRLREVQAPAV
jgi:RNA polymerase sigma-70 factor, ECF subfamily